MSSRHTIAAITGGFGLPGVYAPGVLTELVPAPTLADPPPEPGGWGDRFGEDFGGGVPAPAAQSPSTTIPDDGGLFLTVTLYGAPNGRYRATVGGVGAYSGVPGQGFDLYQSGEPVPEQFGEGAILSVRTLRFVAPAGLATGAHDIVIAGPGGYVETFAGAVSVVRRPRRVLDYSFRAKFPPGSYTALRGLVELPSGEVLDP